MKVFSEQEYFNAAKDWYFDRYETASLQANRWFLGFLLSVIVIAAVFLAKFKPDIIPFNIQI